MKARSKAMMKATQDLSQYNETYAKSLKAQLDSNLLLRMEHLHDWSQEIIYASTDKALFSHRKQKQAMNKNMMAGMPLGLLSTLIVMGLSSILAMHNLVPIGAVLASGHLIGRITSPIGEMGRIYTNYKAGKDLKAKVEKQFNISGNLKEDYISIPDSDKINIESISLTNLNFSIAEKHILKKININFEGGKKYAIVGQAGSGKSTILKLIAGILDSNSQIEYNGKNLSQQEIFDNICYIPQNITILEESLEDNIILNGKNKSCDGLIEKVGLTELAEKRKTDSNKIDSTVSGGEKQKIAMARALFKDSSVFLLDEFNSGLDNHSIKRIEDIVSSQTNKLVVFITHRLNLETLEKCDEIIYLQDGKIIEHGNFARLLENENSAFKNFYENGRI